MRRRVRRRLCPAAEAAQADASLNAALDAEGEVAAGEEASSAALDDDDVWDYEGNPENTMLNETEALAEVDEEGADAEAAALAAAALAADASLNAELDAEEEVAAREERDRDRHEWHLQIRIAPARLRGGAEWMWAEERKRAQRAREAGV